MSKVEEKPVCEKRKTTFWEKARERKVKNENDLSKMGESQLARKRKHSGRKPEKTEKENRNETAE